MSTECFGLNWSNFSINFLLHDWSKNEHPRTTLNFHSCLNTQGNFNWSNFHSPVSKKALYKIQHIFAYFSEFVRFFKNSKKRNVRSLSNSTFDDGLTGENFDGTFKIAKFVFFRTVKIALFWPSGKHEFYDFKGTIEVFTSQTIIKHWVAQWSNIPLFWIFEKSHEFAKISNNVLTFSNFFLSLRISLTN